MTGELLFSENLWPYFDTDPHNGTGVHSWAPGWDAANNLQVVTALVFTSTCGVLEGANLSGDLKNPARSLPKGTLFAQLTAFTVYITFALLLAGCFDRDTLRCDYYVLQDTCFWEYIVVIGMAMATLSTSLGALFGGARVLQARLSDLFAFVSHAMAAYCVSPMLLFVQLSNSHFVHAFPLLR